MSQPPGVEDFRALDLRVGTIERAEMNAGAREPAYRLWISLGDTESVQSSAKLTERYTAADLIGKQVVVAAGFPPIRVGGFRSDVLVLGALTGDGVVLLIPDASVPPGSAIA